MPNQIPGVDPRESSTFADAVLKIVGPTLEGKGFSIDEIDADIDEGGRSGSAVYFRSVDCKIQIYKSAREGNINTMIAPLGAPNEFGPHDRSATWKFLNEFQPAPDPAVEELAKTVSYEARSEPEQLAAARDRIIADYDTARAEILRQETR